VDNATCKSRVGLPYSVLPVTQRTIFGFGCKRTIGTEYMRAIQPCNTDLYCIVVTSWHCVLHRKLAIKILLLSTNNFCYVVAGQPTSEQSVVVLDKVDDTFRESVCDVFLIFYRSIMFVHIAAFRLQRGSSKHCTVVIVVFVVKSLHSSCFVKKQVPKNV